MRYLTRIKELLPAPDNGSPSVDYYITSTHTEIDATESGTATVPGLEITLTQWKRVGQNPSVVSSDLYFGFARIKDGVASPWGTPAKTTRLTLLGRDADTYNCIEARLWDDDWHVVSQFPINVKWKAKDGDRGADAVTYEIRLAPSVVTRHNNNTISPSSVVISTYRKVGDESPLLYSGYLVINSSTGSVIYAGNNSTYGVNVNTSMNFPLKVRMWASEDDVNGNPLAEEYIQMVSDGEAGDTQLMYYPAGIYKSTKTYVRDEHSCPIVLFNGYYYCLKVATNRVSGMAHDPTDSDYWELAKQFSFAIIEALFAAFAHLGSFIVSGDFFISQYGTLFQGSTEIAIGANNHTATWGGKVPYIYFDASDPWVNTLPASGSYKFRPTLVLDAMTGSTYQNNSFVRGLIHATGGNFVDVKISGKSTFKGVTIKEQITIDGNNIDEFATESDGIYEIDIEKTGTFIVFDSSNINASIRIQFPSLLKYIGNRVIIATANNQVSQDFGVVLCGSLSNSTSHVSSLQSGEIASLQCILGTSTGHGLAVWNLEMVGSYP